MSGSPELWLEVVNGIIGDTPRGSLLDLCCGRCNLASQLGFKQHVGVDVNFYPETRILTGFVECDALVFLNACGDKCYDLALCSDGLEHFPREKGLIMLSEMCRVAKLAIVFVPTGQDGIPYPIEADSDDPHIHKDEWSVEEFNALGWQTRSFPHWHDSIGLGAIFAWRKNE